MFFNPQFKLIAIQLLFGLLGLVGSVNGQVLGDYRSAGNGNWGSNTTWQRWDGTAWVAAAVAPADNAAITISIRNSHNVTLAATINNGVSKTIIETGGTLTVASGKTLKFGSLVTGNKLTINGTLVNNGTVTFSGTSIINAGGVLENGSTGTLGFSGSALQLDVNGTVRNSSNNVFSATAAVLQFNNGAVYDHILSSSSVIPMATWNTGSTCIVSSLIPISAVVPLNSNQSFYNLTWNTPGFSSNSSATIQLTSIRGNLIINSTGSGTLVVMSLSEVRGNFTTSTSSVTLGFGVNANVGGDIIFANGSVTSTGKISLTLDNALINQTVDVKGLTIENLIINKPNLSVLIASSLKITGSLRIESTNTIVNSNGNIRLLSTNDEGSDDAFVASLPSGSSVTGTVVVEQYMSNEGNIYRYIASPVAGFPVSGLQASVPVTGSFAGASACVGCSSHSASMFYYNTATTAYIAFPKSPQNNTATFAVGRGYSAFVNQNTLPGPATIQWSGVINQGTLSLPVQYSGNPNTSWNLIGNPYPSTINWNNTSGWTSTNVAEAIAVKDNSTGVFQYYPDAGGNETFNVGMIAKGQAFWVRTTGANPVLQINETAKSSETIGTFYRVAQPTEPTDRIMLSLSNGSTSDRTYYKIVNGAVESIDNFDAPKMTNDGIGTLNFSSFMKKSNLTMAINAVDKITCGDTIKLKVNGANGQSLAAGNYTISFSSNGIMNRFSWTLRDTYLKSEISISDAGAYSFAVTSVSASKSANRFQLVVADKAANVALPVDASKQLCGNASNVIKIANTESRVEYAVMVNGKQASGIVKGNGSDVSFLVAASNFIEGNNIVKVVTNAGCRQTYLSDTVVVEKSSYYVPQVKTAVRCKSERVTLTADVPEGHDVRWYSSGDAVTALASGPIFETSVLEKSETYYVSGINAIGCEGDRIPVQAQVLTYDDVLIVPLNSSTLASNYADGNQWYVDNELIVGATQQSIVAEKQGIYSVRVLVGNCLTTDQFEFIPAAITTPGSEEINGSPVDSDASDNIMVYPNPVAQAPLHIDVPESVTEVKLLDAMGAVVEGVIFSESDGIVKKSAIDLGQYAAGIYFVSMKQAGKIITIKVLNR